MTAAIEVLSVTGSVSLQDHGRAGFQRYGVAEGGAMDRFALHQGAALLGNSGTEAALEMAAAGLRFKVIGGPVRLACSGADMSLKINGQTLRWNSSFIATPDDIIEIGAATNGVYGYLHVAGGFQVAAILGSFATHIRAGFGGFHGRALAAGDRLSVGLGVGAHRSQWLPAADYFGADVIRIVWGAQAHLFDEKIRRRFLGSRFTMSVKRDRMGARLTCGGDTFLPDTGLTGISDAVLAGDIQIAGDGAATVLLADRQPTGGYPRIATIISADMSAIAQMRSGQQFRFEQVGIEQAVLALRERDRQIRQLPDQLRALLRDPAEMADLLEYNLIDGVTTGDDCDRP